jgi:hypothetical protein
MAGTTGSTDGGSSDGQVAVDGTAETGGGTPGGAEGIYAKLNGDALAFPANFTVRESGGSLIMSGGMAGMTHNFTVLARPELGTYGCKSGGSLSYLRSESGNAVTYAANALWGDCLITVTKAAAAKGDFWEGTFTGSLTLDGGGAAKFTVTDGTFKMTKP